MNWNPEACETQARECEACAIINMRKQTAARALLGAGADLSHIVQRIAEARADAMAWRTVALVHPQTRAKMAREGTYPFPHP